MQCLHACYGKQRSLLKVVPEIENEPIGRRRRWQTRTRAQVIQDLRTELGLAG